MLISPRPSQWPRYIETLASVSQYVIPLTVSCYASGFVIANLYLGSLGIVNLEVVRARYVLTGMLFLFLIACIFYLTFDTAHFIRYRVKVKPLSILPMFIFRFIMNTGVLYYMILALRVLGTSAITGPLPLPHMMHAAPRPAASEIVYNTLQQLLTVYLALAIGTVGTLLLVSVAVVVVNPKRRDGSRSRRRIIAELIKSVQSGWQRRNASNTLLYIIITFFVLSIVFSVLSMLSSVTVSMELGPDWGRFLLLIISSYLLFSLVIAFGFYVPGQSRREEEDTPVIRMRGRISLISFLVMFIIPVYALNVYPFLPQQLGGGRPLPVQILTVNSELRPIFSGPSAEVFLIDRTSQSALVCVYDVTLETSTIMEIASSEVISITYLPNWQPSGLNNDSSDP